MLNATELRPRHLRHVETGRLSSGVLTDAAGQQPYGAPRKGPDRARSVHDLVIIEAAARVRAG